MGLLCECENFGPSFPALYCILHWSQLQCPLNTAQYISRPIHQPASGRSATSEYHVSPRAITHPGHAAPRLHGPPPPLEQVVALVRYIRGALAAAAELGSV